MRSEVLGTSSDAIDGKWDVAKVGGGLCVGVGVGEGVGCGVVC